MPHQGGTSGRRGERRSGRLLGSSIRREPVNKSQRSTDRLRHRSTSTRFLPAELGEWPLSRPMAQWLARVIIGGNRTSGDRVRRGMVLAGHCARPRRRTAHLSGASARLLGRSLGGGGTDEFGGRRPDRRRSVAATLERWPVVVVPRYPAQRRGARPLRSRLDRAPPRRYGRSSPLHDVYPFLTPGAVVVLDDAARIEEQTQRRHLALRAVAGSLGNEARRLRGR